MCVHMDIFIIDGCDDIKLNDWKEHLGCSSDNNDYDDDDDDGHCTQKIIAAFLCYLQQFKCENSIKLL